MADIEGIISEVKGLATVGAIAQAEELLVLATSLAEVDGVDSSEDFLLAEGELQIVEAVAFQEEMKQTYADYVNLIGNVPSIDHDTEEEFAAALASDCEEVKVVKASGFNGMVGRWNRVALLCGDQPVFQGHGAQTLQEEPCDGPCLIDTLDDINALNAQVSRMLGAGPFVRTGIEKSSYPQSGESTTTWVSRSR